MPAGEDKLIYPVQHFRLDLMGGETIGLFTSATVPGVNITAPDWKAENEQKKPQNYHAGVQVTYSDLQLTRGIDAERRPQTLTVDEWSCLADALGPLP